VAELVRLRVDEDALELQAGGEIVARRRRDGREVRATEGRLPLAPLADGDDVWDLFAGGERLVRPPDDVSRALVYPARHVAGRKVRPFLDGDGVSVRVGAPEPPQPPPAVPGRRVRPAWGDGGVHILLSHAYGMGGTVRSALTLAGELAPSRPVELISVQRSRATPFFPFPDGVRVTVLDDGRRGGWLRRVPSLLVHPDDHMFAHCSAWTDLRLARHLRRLRGGVLITTRPGFNLLAARARPGALVTLGQEHMNAGAHLPGITRAIRRHYGGLDALAVLTEADERDYRALLPDTRVVQIPNAVPELDGPVASPDAKVVVAAGRLNRQKGFDLLLEAFAPVAAAHPDWQLRIYGRGRERGALRAQIDAAGLYEQAFLMGPAERLGEELAKGSVFVLSSRFEGFGIVLVEAMGKGLAAISFDCARGPGEIVADGRDGVLVPDGDVAALSRALEALVGDRDRRARLAAAGRETARRYDPAAIGERWRTLLDALVNAR
jgi:glycosyltransferase involved in cell wall biosynthesis